MSYDPAQLPTLLGVPFSTEQLTAIRAAPTPLLVVAGAGSGKTTVMAARVVHLVGCGQVAAGSVLGLTFTNKAAGELDQRIRAALRRAGVVDAPEARDAPDAAVAADGGLPTVSTYHAFAARLVRDHGLRLGFEPDARLLAEGARYQLAARVLRRTRLRPRYVAGTLGTVTDRLVRLEADLNDHLITPEQVRAHDDGVRAAVNAQLALRTTRGLAAIGKAVDARAELLELVAEYRAAKAAVNSLDFGDQIARAVALAELPEVQAAERALAPVVLLDEYQDTSVAQRRMLAALFGGGHPVTAVGDPRQAIYGWRGASVSNLTDFGAHFAPAGAADRPAAVRRLNLPVNHRSGGRLVDAANALADQLLRVRGGDAVAPLQPRAGTEQAGSTVVGFYPDAPAETAALVSALRERIDAGRDPAEIAVLLRTWAPAAGLRDALVAAGIPVQVVGLGGLLAMPEVADLVATLHCLVDPVANAAVLRLLAGPRWRVGPADLERLGAHAAALVRRDHPGGVDGDPTDGPAGGPAQLRSALVDPVDAVSLSDCLLDDIRGVTPGGLAAMRALGEELHALRRRVPDPLVDLVRRVTHVTGLAAEVLASPRAVAAHRHATLRGFVDVAASFTDLDGTATLRGFLDYLAAAEEHTRGVSQEEQDSTDTLGARAEGAVQILTVHRAKGLEWPVVVLPWVVQGTFPSSRGQGDWTTSGHVVPHPLREDRVDLPAGPASWDSAGRAAYKAARDKHQLVEETRLAYVAVTRARDELIATGHAWRVGRKNPCAPSPFLLELRGWAERHGTVLAWEQPVPGAVSPFAAGVSAPWPAPLDPQLLAPRLAAAAAVRARLGPGGSPPTTLTAPTTPAADLTAAERALVTGWDRDLPLLVEETRAQRRAAHAVTLPDVLTVSGLQRLLADPQGFTRALARPMPAPPSASAARGTAAHAWVAGLLSAPATATPLVDLDELPGAADPAVPAALLDADSAALRHRFLDSRWVRRPVAAVEVPFAVVLAGQVLRGQIDAVFDDGPAASPRWLLVDWKTGTSAADPLQLAAYRVAWAELRGVPVTDVDAAFVYLDTGQEVHPELPDRAGLEAALSTALRR